MSRDPVCGKDVDALRARAVGIWGGRTYYFCSPEHKAEFARDPAAYGEHGAREPTVRAIPIGGRSPTPAPTRAPTPVPARAPTPARASTPAPVVVEAAPATAQSFSAEPAPEDAAPAPPRSAALKLVLLCALALGAGLLFFVLRR